MTCRVMKLQLPLSNSFKTQAQSWTWENSGIRNTTASYFHTGSKFIDSSKKYIDSSKNIFIFSLEVIFSLSLLLLIYQAFSTLVPLSHHLHQLCHCFVNLKGFLLLLPVPAIVTCKVAWYLLAFATKDDVAIRTTTKLSISL